MSNQWDEKSAPPPQPVQDDAIAEQRPPPARGVLRDVGGIVAKVTGAVLGFAIGGAIARYLWPYILIPGAVAIAVFALVRKLPHRATSPYLPAFAIQAGYLTWLVVGAAISGSGRVVLFDICVLTSALAWLLLRPGSMPAFVLLAYQSVGIIMNSIRLAGTGPGTEQSALVTHLVLRLVAVVFIVAGILTSRSHRARYKAEVPKELGR